MLALDGCDKSVTPARIVGDVALTRAAIAQRLAERGDMNPQSPLVDNRIGPGAGDEFVLADRFAGAFDQRYQNIQRPAAEAQRFPVFEQHSLCRDQPQRPEDERLVIHRETSPRVSSSIRTAEKLCNNRSLSKRVSCELSAQITAKPALTQIYND